MAGITQNEQPSYFHCGPSKIWIIAKAKKGVSKSCKDSKTAGNQE